MPVRIFISEDKAGSHSRHNTASTFLSALVHWLWDCSEIHTLQ